jgi:cytochrome c nitrite reductase small subunit
MGSQTTRAVGPLLIAGVVFGLLVGLGLYTFVYAQGGSYLTNDPAACVNCHVMNEQYNGWLKSSHHTVAVCNDCHTPHDLIGKYSTKALNGFWHSFAFTSGRFPDNIRITPRNGRITEAACRSCHDEMVHAIDVSGGAEPDTISCVRCHGTVGHGPR